MNKELIYVTILIMIMYGGISADVSIALAYIFQVLIGIINHELSSKEDDST